MADTEDFISVAPRVRDREDLHNFFDYPMMHDMLFERKTSPWEMSMWNPDELKKFHIDIDNINRVYAARSVTTGESLEGDFSLTARMKYKEKNIFVSLMAMSEGSGFESRGAGEIYVTYDANIFYNTIVSDEPNSELIMASLCADNYEISVHPLSGKCRVDTWHNPSSLMFLCFAAIKANQHRLAHYREKLPKGIAQNVEEYIKVREAVDDFYSTPAF